MCFHCAILTVVTVVINQNDLFDQVRRTFLQDAETRQRQRCREGGKEATSECTPADQNLHLPDHSPQQSGAGFIVEGDDHTGSWQI